MLWFQNLMIILTKLFENFVFVFAFRFKLWPVTLWKHKLALTAILPMFLCRLKTSHLYLFQALTIILPMFPPESIAIKAWGSCSKPSTTVSLVKYCHRIKFVDCWSWLYVVKLIKNCQRLPIDLATCHSTSINVNHGINRRPTWTAACHHWPRSPTAPAPRPT